MGNGPEGLAATRFGRFNDRLTLAGFLTIFGGRTLDSLVFAALISLSKAAMSFCSRGTMSPFRAAVAGIAMTAIRRPKRPPAITILLNILELVMVNLPFVLVSFVILYLNH
jgi:hypothetical protein